MRRFLFLLALIPVIFWGIWISFPVSAMQSVIESSPGVGRLSIEVKGLKKGFFYSVNADEIILENSGERLIAFSHVHGRINPLGLAAMRGDLSLTGRLASGTFSGEMIVEKDDARTHFDFERADIGEIPFLNRAGMHGKGFVSGTVETAGNRGHIEFAAKNVKFDRLDFSGLTVPMDLFHDVTGSLVVEGNVIEVTSISLEGRDIYARLKGSIQGRVTDLRLDLMPGKSFVENPLFAAQLNRYQVSPGYYVIPIRGDISL